jgi:ribonuclease BN (tRNA processing enzyme)
LQTKLTPSAIPFRELLARMRIVALGTGGFHPSEMRHSACFFLPTEGIVLDGGTSTFRIKSRLETEYLDILVSHAHLDHIVGLTYLIELRDACSTMRGFMSSKTAAAVRDHLFCEPIFPVKPPFSIVEIDGSNSHTLQSGCTMRCFPLIHPGGSFGYRLDWTDKSLAYVTDTTAALDASYLEHIQDVDLLIHECYFPDGQEELAKKTGHSCATPVAQVAQAVNAKQLLIVHVDPTSATADPINMDVICNIFPGAQLGTDLMELDF